MDYVYVESRGAHGVHAHNLYDVHLGSQREIWIGSDGSGMIREARGPLTFYTEAGRAAWEAAGSPDLTHGLVVELYAPDCLGLSRRRWARLPTDPKALGAALATRAPITLRDIYELLGEALVTPERCCALYDIATHLPGVELLDAVSDQLGRPGHGLARVEHGHRIELIFNSDATELIANQSFLAEASSYAPAGTLVSWSAYVDRQLVDALPAGTPPIPCVPCSPPGTGSAGSSSYHVLTG